MLLLLLLLLLLHPLRSPRHRDQRLPRAPSVLRLTPDRLGPDGCRRNERVTGRTRRLTVVPDRPGRRRRFAHRPGYRALRHRLRDLLR
uniref:Putative secreted protein n=1 Tax=Anopheles marajoara TaxID=58244 RepID=A0A2M4CAA6_9DIPT